MDLQDYTTVPKAGQQVCVCVWLDYVTLPKEHRFCLQFFTLNHAVLELSLIIASKVEHMGLKEF